MKIQKGGMYGAAVVSVIVALSIFLTVALNVETETRQVTKYEYVTDTTGLFDFDDSPQYYDFDLNKNYTGYYLRSTSPYWSGTPYWGGASFTSTAGQVITDDTEPEDLITGGSVNTYYVNFDPENVYSSAALLSWVGATNVFDNLQVSLLQMEIIDGKNVWSESNYATNVKSMMLTDLLNYYNPTWEEHVENLNMQLIREYTTSAGDVILDTKSSVEKNIVGGAINYFYNPISPLQLEPSFSCIVDHNTGVVDLYSDTGCKNYLKSASLSDVVIIWGGTASTSQDIPAFGFDLGVVSYQAPPTIYMDISKGVTVSSTGSA